MAFVETEGASIYWHELGQGEPIVLIMGLGCSSAMWVRLAPRLAGRHRVILLDNRGAGQTKASGALVHRVANMARDVAAVLDAAGLRHAHVVGFSMGGMIAQQLAIDHASRVRSLTLLATNCGNPYAKLPAWDVQRLLFDRRRETPEQALNAMRPYVYGRATPEQRIAEDNTVRIASFPPRNAYDAQLYGLLYWTSYFQLPRLRMPTLIIHGLEDQLIPPQNGHLLASRIPGAELVEITGASHFAHTDNPEAVVEAVTTFVARVT